MALQGKDAEAEASCRRAIEIKPDYAEAHCDLGGVLTKRGKLDEAAASCRRALELQPGYATAHYLLGLALAKQKKLDEAAASFREALARGPNDADAHYNLGIVLKDQRKLDEALASFRRALQLKPGYFEAENGLGAALAEQKKFDEAVSCYRRSLALAPNYIDALNNLGTALVEQGKTDEAMTCFHRALELEPDCFAAHYNLSNAYVRKNQLDDALASCKRALELMPDHADAHAFQGMILIAVGRLAEAWPQYEWRLKAAGSEDVAPPRPYWDGSPLTGRTILLRCEQGHGDTIQFIRYAQSVKQQDSTVIVECPRSLVELVKSCPGVDRVIARGESRPSFDVQIPLLSLPGILHTSLDTIPNRVPYLSADPARVEHWRHELEAGDWRPEAGGRKDSAVFSSSGLRPPVSSLKIGIAWQGNPDYRFDRFRSIPLEHFSLLAGVEGVRLYSLQFGPGRQQLTDSGGRWPITRSRRSTGRFLRNGRDRAESRPGYQLR